MQCPQCLQHIHESRQYEPLIIDQKFATDDEGLWGTAVSKCPACKRIIVELGTLLELPPDDFHSRPPRFIPTSTMRFVRPKAISRAPIPSEIPTELASDYSEACLVLLDSEKASAALSRRCLQHLLHEKLGIKERSLADEIQKLLDSKQLPSYLVEELDAIRNIGNFAAHPLKDTHTGEIVEVEPHEAEWLFNLLDGLFDFCFIQPAKAKARQDALNAKLHSAGKPAMKKP